MTDLLTVHDAQERIISAFQALPPEIVYIKESLHRVLAVDITADTDLPPFDNSSMDGFAVRSADIGLASPSNPIILSVIEDIPAGAFPQMALQPGQAARIMTGAPIPSGCDAVIPIEDTDYDFAETPVRLPYQLKITESVKFGTFIRPHGQDIQRGQVVLQCGRRIGPAEVGLLASLGVSRVPVYNKPMIALLSTGDELISPDQPLSPGKIRNSNSYAIAALIEEFGAEVLDFGTAPDQPEIIRQRLQDAVDQNADLILTTAGVSVGAFDYVKPVIQEKGNLTFWRVNMRPGKPLAFGSYQGIPLLGLPGNPVSAYVGFLVFVLPAIHKMAGILKTKQQVIRAILTHPVESDGRESYLRAVVKIEGGQITATLTGHQGSGNMFSLVQANALLIVPSGVKSLPIGAEVFIWPLTNELT
ncbi:MAG TPA: gephyrin-like molybdotransferase Glp [Anaerolineaceae bacterium]|nr:gephyrin-like molybdotransferase Glp [Anaerolineaceae bacterium]